MPARALSPLTLLLSCALLAACSPAPEAPPAADAGAPPTAARPEAPGTPGTPEAPASPALDPAVDMADAVPFESPLGYTILVPPTFAMTQEEPCCDQAWLRGSDGHFLRIERLPGDAPLARLQDDMRLALSAVGEPQALPPSTGPEGHEVELLMQAANASVRTSMMISRVGAGRYRITRHLPTEGDADAIDAEMRAMLASMATTGPRIAP